MRSFPLPVQRVHIMDAFDLRLARLTYMDAALAARLQEHHLVVAWQMLCVGFPALYAMGLSAEDADRVNQCVRLEFGNAFWIGEVSLARNPLLAVPPRQGRAFGPRHAWIETAPLHMLLTYTRDNYAERYDRMTARLIDSILRPLGLRRGMRTLQLFRNA